MKKCIVCAETFVKGSRISFHVFPKNKHVRDLWLKRCDLDEWDITNHSTLCSKHFSPGDFDSCEDSRTRILKKTAIPSICLPVQFKKAKRSLDFGDVPSTSTKRFQHSEEESSGGVVPLERSFAAEPKLDPVGRLNPPVEAFAPETEMEPSETLNTPVKSTTHESVVEMQSIEKSSLCKSVYQSPRYPGDMKTHHFATPRKAARNLERMQQKLTMLQVKVKNLQNIAREKTKRIEDLKTLFLELRQKDLISENAFENLMETTPEPIQEMLNRKIKCSGKYSPALRSFAITLHFYSPRAYEYVRMQMKKLLPHPRTIRKWYCVVNGEPGFTAEAFKALAAHVEEINQGNKDKEDSEKLPPPIVNVTLDEMSIREKLEWDGTKYVGLVDLGTGSTDSSDAAAKAKNVLVFMAVALNKHWKIPLGYFLIKGLSSSERASLLTKCLELVHDTKTLAFSITFDGAASNIAMCTALGACLDYSRADFCPSFKHPITAEPVFIFFNACHMLKLLRNLLAQKKLLKNSEGATIAWSYLERLVELQKTERLHAANKLTDRHINFQNSIMNVRLAAQALSSSVASSLMFCEEHLKRPEFEGPQATAAFCLRVNNIFDILNSRNRFSKYTYSQAISDDNIQFIEEYAQQSETYLASLTDEDGRPIIKTNRKTGVLGFIICLRNIINVYKKIRQFNKITFLYSYKLSQDHLEMFFSAVRSREGFNNNPSAKQFAAAYKRLLVRHQIASSKYGNCAILDATSILHVSSSIRTPDSIHAEDEIVSEDFVREDHDYVESLWNVTEYVAEVVKYIAGFIVMKLGKKQLCTQCLQTTVSSESHSALEAIKSRGRLTKPSIDVCNLCIITEHCFRQYQGDIFRKRNILQFLTVKVLGSASDLFCSAEMLEHIKQQEVFDNHRTQLMKAIVQLYLVIRLHHEGKLQSSKSIRIRQKYTKLILFSNE